jgi:hypothetical protein
MNFFKHFPEEKGSERESRERYKKNFTDFRNISFCTVNTKSYSNKKDITFRREKWYLPFTNVLPFTNKGMKYGIPSRIGRRYILRRYILHCTAVKNHFVLFIPTADNILHISTAAEYILYVAPPSKFHICT